MRCVQGCVQHNACMREGPRSPQWCSCGTCVMIDDDIRKLARDGRRVRFALRNLSLFYTPHESRRWTRLLDVLRNLQSSARRRRLRSRPWSAVAAISPSTRCVTHRLPFGPRGSPRNPNEPKITRSLARSLLSGPRSDRVHNTGVSFAEIIGNLVPRQKSTQGTTHRPIGPRIHRADTST